MQTVEDLELLNEYKGKIWIIDSLNNDFYNEFFKDEKEFKFIKSVKFKTKYPSIFDTKYEGYDYNLILLEK